MAGEIWRNLLALLYRPEKPEGFRSDLRNPGRRNRDGGVPWITTFTAQCLKVMVAAELIPGAGPETLAELDAELREHPPEFRLYGA